MCQLGGVFKLCTCETNIPKGVPYWELKSWTKINDITMIEMGRCMNLTYDNTQQDFANHLVSSLNHQSVFDFDYTPTKDDILNITLYDNNLEIKFEFYFNGRVWIINHELSEHLNRAMIIHQGKVMI